MCRLFSRWFHVFFMIFGWFLWVSKVVSWFYVVSWFSIGFHGISMCFHDFYGLGWFLCFSMWFHVVLSFGLASIVFQGGFMVFHDSQLVFMVFSRWFFIGYGFSRWFLVGFHVGNFMVSYLIWNVSVSYAEKTPKCTHSNLISLGVW